MKRAGIVLLLAVGAARAGEAPNLAIVTPPAAKITVKEAIETGVDFLVQHQNKDGSFGHHVSGRTRELWCQVPGGHQAFKAASTALCWLGLSEAPHQPAASRKAQAKCLGWLARNAAVKRAYGEQFYNIWAYGYGLRALGLALQKRAPGAEPEQIRATMSKIIEKLGVLQSPEGGWSYLDFRFPGRKPTSSNSFTAATVMIGLYEAREAGIEVPQKMVDRAVRYVWSQRTPEGNYFYSVRWKNRPAGRINRPQGSSMRNQACNIALHLFDGKKMGLDKMRVGLEQLRDNHRFAIAGLRRPIPHESWYAVSGYFYLYGQQYAALVLDKMPAVDRRLFWPGLVKSVLKTRQKDGSYWDYPTYNYHKFYGTGYALIALSRCPTEIAAKLKPES